MWLLVRGSDLIAVGDDPAKPGDLAARRIGDGEWEVGVLDGDPGAGWLRCRRLGLHGDQDGTDHGKRLVPVDGAGVHG